MILGLILVGMLAGEPTMKGSKLLDDGAAALSVKTVKIPGGTTSTTVSTLDGATVLVMNLSPLSPGQGLLAADFQGLGLNFGGMVPEPSASELLLGWWRAGVLTREGADREALATWAASRGFTLTDTAAAQASFASAMASRPPPAFTPAPTPSSAPSSSRSSSSGSTSSASAAPATVSVSMHISCGEKVRVFFGSSASSSGTYGWESPNSTRSVTVKPGSVICIADSHDKVGSCWTAGEQRVNLDVGCGGFTAR